MPSTPTFRRARARLLFFLVALLAVSLAAAPASARVVENLYGAKLVDENTGFVVGAFGAIYRTSDGGKTWESLKTPTEDYLFAVDFSSPRNGVAVGKAGAVLTTDDGGTTWVKRDAGTDRNLFSVAFASPQHVWAIGDWGAVFESRDGGATWKDRTLPNDVVLTSQSWPDDQNGFIAGEFGTIERTTDGGATWSKMETGTEKTLFGVAFSSPTTGWAVGIDGLVVRTRDGGATWQVQRGALGGESLEALGFMEALRNPGLYDIRFADGYGYIVGDIGMILVSSDGGETWAERKLPPEMSLFWLRGVSAAKGGRALVVGASGLIAIADKGEVRLNHGG
jgi:photosystem II stability/assembly factor-like uncharacterized protein